MKKLNYFLVHKNKKPKKAKYSKHYTKLQIQKIECRTQIFLDEIKKIKIINTLVSALVFSHF